MELERDSNLGLASTDGMKPVSRKSRRVALIGLLDRLAGIGATGGSASSRAGVGVLGLTSGHEGTRGDESIGGTGEFGGCDGSSGEATGSSCDESCGLKTTESSCEDESCELETTESSREGEGCGTLCGTRGLETTGEAEGAIGESGGAGKGGDCDTSCWEDTGC